MAAELQALCHEYLYARQCYQIFLSIFLHGFPAGPTPAFGEFSLATYNSATP